MCIQVSGWLHMGILPRLRYILEVLQAANAVHTVMSILCLIASHSKWAAAKIVECPRLLSTVRGKPQCLPQSLPQCVLAGLFVESDIASRSGVTQYPYGGYPVSGALKLIRILAQVCSAAIVCLPVTVRAQAQGVYGHTVTGNTEGQEK